MNAAEAAWSFHTVKHHNSYRSMDCTSALLKKTLPDSDTAKKFSCARTKTKAIVDGVLAPHSVEVAHEALKDIPYCGVSTDGSRAGPRHKRTKRLPGYNCYTPTLCIRFFILYYLIIYHIPTESFKAGFLFLNFVSGNFPEFLTNSQRRLTSGLL